MTDEQMFELGSEELTEIYLTFRGKASDTLASLASARREGKSQLETILLSEYELYTSIADKIRFQRGR